MHIFIIRINSAIPVSIKASKVILIERLVYSVNLGYILLKIRVRAIITSQYKCSLASFTIVITPTLTTSTKTPFSLIIAAKSFS
jgi:hypothetical protein